jgi:D-glycero-D-manno-heptose 1,7-bisphosphate phosphatase
MKIKGKYSQMYTSDNKMNKAFFLDRDGVINIELNYVGAPENFHFINGVFDACRIILSHGYRLIIITNQSGIARGYYTLSQFSELNAWMLREFKKERIDVTEVYFCPHHPIAGLGAYKVECECRKPKPGMILRAKNEHNIDLAQSVLVGDHVSDIEAGENAGIGSLFLVDPANKKNSVANPCQNLLDAVHHYFNN